MEAPAPVKFEEWLEDLLNAAERIALELARIREIMEAELAEEEKE